MRSAVHITFTAQMARCRRHSFNARFLQPANPAYQQCNEYLRRHPSSRSGRSSKQHSPQPTNLMTDTYVDIRRNPPDF